MSRGDRYRWSHGFTASCSHVGGTWTSDMYKIDFVAFKLLDPSPRNHVRIEDSLRSMRITSLTNPHDDLPGDMEMFAQLIIDEIIFLQTLPVASGEDQRSWKLEFGCNMIHRPSHPLSPAHAPTFSVAVLRQSETEGKRLVGYVEIRRGEILESVESNGCTFQLLLNKVNSDGPSLKFSTGFSVSELPRQEISALDLIDMPESTSEIA
ncbi:hypothetical protein K438DRAFT_1779174 [Mycena galopus ATCC 62051]|nr:hypothetical protein K438DRAFT_1779174 [Mycena galopus ATCC 62051]